MLNRVTKICPLGLPNHVGVEKLDSGELIDWKLCLELCMSTGMRHYKKVNAQRRVLMLAGTPCTQPIGDQPPAEVLGWREKIHQAKMLSPQSRTALSPSLPSAPHCPQPHTALSPTLPSVPHCPQPHNPALPSSVPHCSQSCTALKSRTALRPSPA